jgi:hypothetical protein
MRSGNDLYCLILKPIFMKSFFFSMAFLCAVCCSHSSFAQCIVSGPFTGATLTNSTSAGTVAWNSPALVALSDDNYTQATQLLPLLSTVNTNYLVVQGLGFAIPTAATICGISVTVERSATGILNLGSYVRDASVWIVKNGSMTGTDHASATNWPGSDAMTTYGNSTDIWGVSWTPADINAANFGVAIAATLHAGLVGLTLTARIDQVTITVYYLNPSVLEAKLGSFKVVARDITNIISWGAAVYDDSTRFIVERSADSRHWQTIGTIQGQIHLRQYLFQDNSPFPGVGYYRLGIAGNSSNIFYSPIQKVFQRNENIGFYPNPAGDIIYITGKRNTPAIVITDLQGRVIRSINIDPSLSLPQVSLTGINPGLYLLEIDGTVLRLRIKR